MTYVTEEWLTILLLTGGFRGGGSGGVQIYTQIPDVPTEVLLANTMIIQLSSTLSATRYFALNVSFYIILCRVYPLLGNDSVNTCPR
jgi:hypothetical protein